MKYLIDTDTLIDYMKDQGDTRFLIRHMIAAGDELLVCAATITEVYSGLAPEDEDRWHSFLDALPYIDIPRHSAVEAGNERYNLAMQGKKVAVTDALLAALAREHQAVILTSNIKDYPAPDIAVRSLRQIDQAT